jgi:cytidylate kinase
VRRLRIAIDGPSGVGKSTVARAVAARLGYRCVESGAMYRAVALAARQTGTDYDDAAALARLAETADIRLESSLGRNTVLLDGRDVTQAIRSDDITEASSRVSVHPGVRRSLVRRQRSLATDGGVVMEGRDIGTVVLPDADLKIFLIAAPQVRGERRLRETEAPSHNSRAVLEAILERDRRDQTREASPLIPAPDAVTIDTTSLAIEQVVQRIVDLAEQRLSDH